MEWVLIMDLNQIITEVTIAIKLDKSLDKLIEKYGEEQINDAMTFIAYDKQELIEIEEDELQGTN
jgi:hypothetical protein